MSRHVIARARAVHRQIFAGADLRTVLLAGSAVLAASSAHAQTVQAPAAAEVDEVVVTGQRLSTANAIEAQRRSGVVSSVISSDDLGKLPDANVADALARAPGINVVVNQETGEGEYVSVRGLAGTFNAYSINGVRVALTDPDSRKMSMTVLPPNGLKSITVSKTLTPDMDGDAIGGSVNFQTPTAFDFTKPVARAFLSYGVNDRAQEQGEEDGSGQIQMDFASRLSSDSRFGAFVSFNYGKSNSLNEETENDGEWEPYRWRKDSEEAIDERSMYLPGIDLDYRRIEQERFGGNFSLDYQGQANDFYLRGQYSRLERTGTNDYTDFRSRKTKRLQQRNLDDTSLIQPENAIVGYDEEKGRVYSYTTDQIVDKLTIKKIIDGKEVMVGDGIITDEDRISGSSYWSLFGRSGVWKPETFQFARTFQTLDQVSTLGTINLGGQSRLNRLTLDYDLSYSAGEKGGPDSFSIGYNCDACSAPFNQTGLLWSSYDPRFPMPQLPAFAQNAQNDPNLLPYDGGGRSRDKQTDARTAFKFDAVYEMEGVVRHLKAGVKVLRSEREYDATPIWGGSFDNTPLEGKSLGQSGLIDREVGSVLNGRYYYGAILNRDRVTAAIEAAQKANPVTYSYADLSSSDKSGEETIYAGYGLASFQFNDLDVVAGVRVEHTEVSNTNWIEDEAQTGFGDTDSNYTNVLPSVTAVYRPSDNFVYRGAIWTSFSRPEFSNISRGVSVGRAPPRPGQTLGDIVSISRGNPDLKPAEALNLDVSAEYYPDRSSLVSIGVFHKKIDHFIFTNGSAVDADTQEGVITISQPKNGETAKITGVELNLIKSFEGMGAPFDGFGVEANLTRQVSEAETGLDYRKGRSISFIQAPDLIYNASLTYQKYGFEARLSYQYQGAYIEDLRDNAVDKWVQPNKSLDFHSRYNFRPGLTMDFDVQNILDGHRYYTTKGESPSYQKDYMEPGRNFLVRLAYSY
ncbi:MAG: TonB-dependent receptor [Phenylobacterium sp.]|uniref:TonB-dependent receptor n=1 Tax=Brevundimonas mediterranea TaxID=74329 RepID=A0AB37E485_9CAUL|nr:MULTISPECIES: TonB-dependent receptor [Brevundimonas]MBA4331469.1 TonB-dependent receptor [Brevundimonas sp.]MDZ4373387.1 TonB-dependent receptor [Phenylobacterium sp.]QIH72070.1 TonB-dependent receptor [Brevundimonas mediterranea]